MSSSLTSRATLVCLVPYAPDQSPGPCVLRSGRVVSRVERVKEVAEWGMVSGSELPCQSPCVLWG